MLVLLGTRLHPGRSCFVPYFVVALQNKILNSHRAGCAYCKHCLRVTLDISILNFAVAVWKKENIWRFGVFLVIMENHENY